MHYDSYPNVPESQELAKHRQNLHLLAVNWWEVSTTCDPSLELAMTIRAVMTDELREQLQKDAEVCMNAVSVTPGMQLRCAPKYSPRFWPVTRKTRRSL